MAPAWPCTGSAAEGQWRGSTWELGELLCYSQDVALPESPLQALRAAGEALCPPGSEGSRGTWQMLTAQRQ